MTPLSYALYTSTICEVIHQTRQNYMQNTLPLGTNSPIRGMTGLARQIALPGEHAPQRFPSFPALERTAVMGFNQPTTLPLPGSATTSITIFRQAAYPVWADVTASYAAMVDYPLDGHSAAAISDSSLTFRNSIMDYCVTTRFASVDRVGFIGTNITAAGLAWPIFGADRGLPGPEFMYVPPNCNLWAVVSCSAPSPSNSAATVTTEWWFTPGESNSQVALGYLSGEATGTIVTGDRGCVLSFGSTGRGSWVRPKSLALGYAGLQGVVVTLIATTSTTITYAPSTSTRGAFDLGPNAARPVMHLPLVVSSEFVNSAIPWYSTRVTAVGMLGTNVTQVLNKGGTILGGRVSPSVQNPWFVTEAYVNGLHPAEKSFLPLETGIYSYCPPSTDLAYFHDYTLNTSSYPPPAPAPLFLLSNDALYNKLYIRPAGAVDESLAVTVSWHIEFRTSSALFQVGLCGMTLESLHQAQLALVEAGFFFENPSHNSVLNRVIAAAKKYVPRILGVVSPMAGRVAKEAVREYNARRRKAKPRPRGPPPSSRRVVVPKPGPTRVRTTTANASGYNGAKRRSGLDMYLASRK